jgi:hypothetical protein
MPVSDPDITRVRTCGSNNNRDEATARAREKVEEMRAQG